MRMTGSYQKKKQIKKDSPKRWYFRRNLKEVSIIDNGSSSIPGYGDSTCKCPEVMNVHGTMLKACVAVVDSVRKEQYKKKTG